jgi:hypothetical protein
LGGDVEMSDSLYYWNFYADNGDQYGGWAFADTGTYYPGWTYDTGLGVYYVYDAYAYGFDLTPAYGIVEGEVYTSYYVDGATGAVYDTYSGGAYAVTTGYIGYEYDYALTPAGYDDFGYGGYYLADSFGGDAIADSLFYWAFYADNGDQYGGWLFADSDTYYPGWAYDNGLGVYAVYDAYAYGFDLTATYGIEEGEVYTSYYVDSFTGQVYSTNSGGTFPTSADYLGYEYDYAVTSYGYDDFGYGGYYLVG